MRRVRLADPNLRDIAKLLGGITTLNPRAKDRLQTFLENVDAKLPTLHEQTAAQLALTDIAPHLDRLYEVVRSVPVFGEDPPARDDVAGIVARIELVIRAARDGRLAEAELLTKLGCRTDGRTVHGDVMAVLENLYVVPGAPNANAKSDDEEHLEPAAVTEPGGRPDAGVHSGIADSRTRSAGGRRAAGR
jgi:hypothetical protein